MRDSKPAFKHKLRTFNLIDEYTRECHCIHADRAIKAADVLALLQEAIARHGPPKYIHSDNDPEFIAKVIQTWLWNNHIQAIYIEPGCPWQNGYAESFNGRFRAECLNRELLCTLSKSRASICRLAELLTMMSDRTVRLACKPQRSSLKINLSRAPAPVGLRPPYAGAFKRNRRRQKNRNQRKLSHLLWAKSRGPTNASGATKRR
ncbi:MAG: DDE-type integrase/transposase/recombinase [Limisphaerales bacterium]